MYKITIESNVHGQVWLTKESQAEVDAYLAWCAETAHWGKPAQVDDNGVVVVEAEYSVEVAEYVDQEAINAEALKYLADTDYYVIRAMEDASKPAPEEIKEARQAARERIVR